MATENKRFICVHSRSFAAFIWLAFSAAASGQIQLTLQQAGSREAPDWTPSLEGKQVVVTGQVSSGPLRVSDSYYLPIQDSATYGLMLHGAQHNFEGFEPGDWLEAKGNIAKRGGLPVLEPQEIRRLSHSTAPAPKMLKVNELAGFRYLGVLVATESTVLQSSENAGGDVVTIGERGKEISIFLPRTRRDSGPQLTGLRAGDRVRAIGIANQYCNLPPYDRFFQILIPSPASVAILEKAWMIPPPFLLASLMLAASVLTIWWFRERRMAALRRQMHFLNVLGEEVIGATSSEEILRRLMMTLPELSNASGIGMYIQNRGTKTLESVHAPGSAGEFIDLEVPNDAMAAGIAACFRNRTLIAVPDTRRSPFFRKEHAATTPRSVLFVPMFAQSELLGVIELHHSENIHYFTQSEQASLQHLANQVATALKLEEQQSIREQLFRSEKLAAAGQVISDVANELRSPLENIAMLAMAVPRNTGSSHRELDLITQEARRATAIVGRLASFAKVEQSEAQPVDLTAILSGILTLRSREREAKGVEIRSKVGGKHAIVMGSAGQLEQVLLNLLVDAEKSAAESREKMILVSSSLLARRVLVEISYSTAGAESEKNDGAEGDHKALGLGVCRGVIQSHGGDFRVVQVSGTQARFDIELPVVETRRADTGADADLRRGLRQLTALIVEPDAKVQRQLVQLLGSRGDRVVPVSSAEEGGDMAQRLRFDLAICDVRLPGLNWVEFFERVRYQVGGFVLLTDGFDNDLERAFQDGEGYVLSKPVDEAEVLRICRAVEEREAVGTGD